MSGTRDKLVRMVNQIAAELEYQQGTNAAAATWDHIWHFWDPRMRAQIIAHLDAGGAGLGATGRDAVAMLRSGAEPSPQTSATEFGIDASGNTQGDGG